ncbi:MAG TPA: DNA repair exonuclease [Bacilli bacterium]
MKSFSFMHTADLHLDSPFRGMVNVPAVIREKVRESTFAALQNLVQLAVKERVDFVVVSGDVYDLADRSLRAQIRFQQAVVKLSEQGIPVFIIHGNHDPEDGRRASLDWPETVHFFGSQNAGMVPVHNAAGELLAQIYGISYPAAAVTVNLLPHFQVKQEAVYKIGLLHSNVDGDPSHDNYAPCSKGELVRSGIDYWALGHIHQRAVLHEEPYVVYPGNLQGRHIKEQGTKGCYVVKVSEYGTTELAFHAVDAIRWVGQSVSIKGLTTEQQLKDLIEEHMEDIKEETDGRSAIVRFTLEGRGLLHPMLQGSYLTELLAELRDDQTKLTQDDDQASFVWIESFKVQSGIPVDMDQLLQQESFLGDLLRFSRSLMGEEEVQEAFSELKLQAFTEAALLSLTSHSKAGKYWPAPGIEEQKELLQAAVELAVDVLAAEAGREE